MVTLQQIHIAASGDLPSIKTQIINTLASGIVTSGWAQDHLYREFNRKCINCGLTGTAVTPMDAGFRPITLPQDIGLDNGYLRPDGVSEYFRPDGSSQYLKP